MRFTVGWKQSALDELAGIWVNADSDMRQAITAATHQIDIALSRNPANLGESRTGDVRIYFVFPLAIRFEVDSQAAKVVVLQVWSYQKKDKGL